LRDLLVFWGEEKAVKGAKDDLIQKAQGIDPLDFGDVKFMICYTADGPRMRFYAFDGSPDASKNPNRFVQLTDEMDTATFAGRFKVLRCVINITRVLITISDILPAEAYPYGLTKDFGTSTISYFFDFVEKKLPMGDLPYGDRKPEDRLEFLQCMYEYARNHPNLVTVMDGPKWNKSGHYCVRFTTRGVPNRPQSEDEVRSFTKDVISALVFLHKGGFLHRDVRFPNIVYDRTIKHYVVIDFEHGGHDGQKNRAKNRKYVVSDTPPLKDWDDKTLVNGVYTHSSDLYQLGIMLKKEFGFLIVSGLGKQFVEGLITKVIDGKKGVDHKWLCGLS
jgi:serine/threonine protein kinase